MHMNISYINNYKNEVNLQATVLVKSNLLLIQIYWIHCDWSRAPAKKEQYLNKVLHCGKVMDMLDNFYKEPWPKQVLQSNWNKAKLVPKVKLTRNMAKNKL